MWKKINLGFPWTVFWPAVFSDIFKIQLQSDSISADAWHMKYHGTLSHTSGLESVTNTTAKLQHLSTAISTHLLSACLTNTVMVERSCFRASNMWNFPFQIQLFSTTQSQAAQSTPSSSSEMSKIISAALSTARVLHYLKDLPGTASA